MACDLCLSGLEKRREGRGEVAGRLFLVLSFLCWSDVALAFATNKGFSCTSRKSWMFNSSRFSSWFSLNLVGSAFLFVLGASHTKITLFFSLVWIQGSIEAKRMNVSCSYIEIKALWLAHFRRRLRVEGGTHLGELWP